MRKMKPVLLVIMSIISLSVYSQTTETEFNYITKGYKIQMESGLDMKNGYSFKDVNSWGINYGTFERKATFKHLYRDGETIPCATLMILARTDSKYKAFVCIPHIESTEEIWDKAFETFRVATKDWTSASQGYVWGMNKMISHLSSM